MDNKSIIAAKEEAISEYYKMRQTHMSMIGYYNQKEIENISRLIQKDYEKLITAYPDLEGKIDINIDDAPTSVPRRKSLLSRLYVEILNIIIGRLAIRLFPLLARIETFNSGYQNNGSYTNSNVKEKPGNEKKRQSENGQASETKAGSSSMKYISSFVKTIGKMKWHKIKFFRIIVFTQLLFGATALSISSYFEYKALSIMLSDPNGNKVLDPIIPVINQPISFPLVILLEGTKAISIVAILYFTSSGVAISKWLFRIVFVFRGFLIMLSLFASMAVLYHFFYNAPLANQMIKKKQEYSNQYAIDTSYINSTYNPLIDTCLKIMSANNTKNNKAGRIYNGADSLRQKHERDKQKELLTAQNDYQKKINEDNLHSEVKKNLSSTSANPIVKSLTDSLNALGIPANKEFISVFVSMMIAALIELSIYVAFNLSAKEFFRQQPSKKYV